METAPQGAVFVCASGRSGDRQTGAGLSRYNLKARGSGVFWSGRL